MPISTPLRARWIIAATLLAAAPIAAQADTFVAREMCYCLVSDFSDNGGAATGHLSGSNDTFRWTASGGAKSLGRGTFRTLHRGSGVPAISADGRVIGSTILDDTKTMGTQGLWTLGTGWQQLMPPRPVDGGVVDAEDGSVFGMSRDGSTVTGLYWRNTSEGGLAHASRWTAATGVADMGSSGGSSRIDDTNRDGSVLVGWDEHPLWGIRRAVVWVNGVKTFLVDPDNDWPSEAGAVNADGTIIVGQAVDPIKQLQSAVMWKWNGSEWVKKILGVLPNTRTSGSAFAGGLSDDGSIVVGTAFKGMMAPMMGFVWTEAGGLVEATQYFRDRGYDVGRKLTLVSVNAISADGLVMGVVAVERKSGQNVSIAVRKVVD